MKRFKYLFGQRRFQALMTIAAILLAASVVAASGADFTSTSANAGNVFTAGTLSMSNSVTGPVVTWSSATETYNMRPGDVATGSVALANTGDVPGAFYLSKTVNAAGDSGLGDILQLQITGPGVNYSGPLSANLTDLDLGTWAPDSAPHQYQFTVTWPNDPGISDPIDTAQMGQGCTYDFTWTAVSNSGI